MLSAPARQFSTVTVLSSTLRAGSEDVLGGAGVTLGDASARLDLGGLSKVNLGTFVGNDAVLALGDTQLTLTNAVASPVMSVIRLGVTGSAASGITVEGAAEDLLRFGRIGNVGVPSSSTIGFLHFRGGTTAFNEASFTLVSTAPETTAPLLVEGGATVSALRADLTVMAQARMRGGGSLTMALSTLSVERDAGAPGSFALLAIGSEGSGLNIAQAVGPGGGCSPPT